MKTFMHFETKQLGEGASIEKSASGKRVCIYTGDNNGNTRIVILSLGQVVALRDHLNEFFTRGNLPSGPPMPTEILNIAPVAVKIPLYSRINTLMVACLCPEVSMRGNAPPDGSTVIECITAKFMFDPKKVEAYKPAIAELCAELPDDFRKSHGGGKSFLEMCVDRDGKQWGEHRNCEALLALAIASGQGGFCMPRGMWNILPGGMPYVWIGE